MPKTDEERGYRIVNSERLPGKLRINSVETEVKKSSKTGRCYVNVPTSWEGKTLIVDREFAEE